MSEFWKYFKDTLRWPLIHRPGPLAALLKGKAHALDEARDDVIYFRRQWFPEFCENGLVPEFGDSRGLVRHPKENAEQFRQRVVHAWAWHFLGGKVEGLPQILKFYGYDIGEIINMRRYTPRRWAEFQLGLKTPATQEEQAALLADLDAIIWLVNEYKPARSVLFRIFTDTYNVEPLIWSQGYWSDGYWSHFSGVEYPDADNPQGPGAVVVSFGMVHRAQAQGYLAGEFLAALGILQTHAFRIPYLDKFIWSESAWSDIIIRNHGFVIGQLLSTHAAELIYESGKWGAGWPERPWASGFHYDRPLPKWQMPWKTISKSQLFYSENSDKRDDWHGWGDINSNWSLPLVAIAGAAPRWGEFVWSNEEPRLTWLRIEEQFQETRPVCSQSFEPQFGSASPHGAHVASGMAFLLPFNDFPVWGRFAWSEKFPPPFSGGMAQLLATLAGSAQYAPGKWPRGGWPQKPWGELTGYGRESGRPNAILAEAMAVRMERANPAIGNGFEGMEQLVSMRCARMAPGLKGGFCRERAAAFMAGEPVCEPSPWPEKLWPAKAWGKIIGCRRVQKPFGASIQGEA